MEVFEDRPEGAVDVQTIKCECGYFAIHFNQVALTACPKCHKTFEEEWPEFINA